MELDEEKDPELGLQLEWLVGGASSAALTKNAPHSPSEALWGSASMLFVRGEDHAGLISINLLMSQV